MKYYNDNKDKIITRVMTRYNKLKDTLNEKVTCDLCGAIYNRQNKGQHERSKKHQKFVKPAKKYIIKKFDNVDKMNNDMDKKFRDLLDEIYAKYLKEFKESMAIIYERRRRVGQV